jgi:hypothetical protein
MQVWPTPVVPVNAADALSRPASYVQAAVEDTIYSRVTDSTMLIDFGPTTEVLKSQAEPSMSAFSNPSERTTYPAAFENPDDQWQRYNVAFRVSDIDRLVLEETVKVSRAIYIYYYHLYLYSIRLCFLTNLSSPAE